MSGVLESQECAPAPCGIASFITHLGIKMEFYYVRLHHVMFSQIKKENSLNYGSNR